jgi:glucose-1-phosphate cytidylyltransferase
LAYYENLVNHGISDFIDCLGYKGDVIKEFLLNFKSYNSSVITNTASGEVTILDEGHEN